MFGGNKNSVGDSGDDDDDNYNGNLDDSFYKDLSLKCIKKCEKFFFVFESLLRDID